MTVTAVMNLKGGPGKTALVNGLAHAAAAKDEDVLVGDVDPQGNTTSHLTGHNARNLPPTGTLADVLDRRVNRPLEDIVVPARTRDRIYVAPSGFGEMQEVQDTLLGQTGGDLSLRRAFKEARKNGRVLFDCRPAVDLITRAAMLASDNVLIVVAPEFDHIEGMISVFTAINDLYEFADYELRVAGVVINLLDGSRSDHAGNVDYIREYCAKAGVPVLGLPIPRLADISRLTNAGLGMDQHPKPSARTRWLAENFAAILDGIDKEAA
ncbi:ParA family protein (plasmid) [Nocardia sp. CA-135953]|uniref:ParA family protein n=1 Tax=Nocardia sp. CA-135953 TaxID=3239978 RepID=UPI003D995F33